jgi:hypothetical protein
MKLVIITCPANNQKKLDKIAERINVHMSNKNLVKYKTNVCANDIVFHIVLKKG